MRTHLEHGGQKFLIQTKALEPMIRHQFTRVEQSDEGKFESGIDANVYAAVTQSCEGSFSGILALHIQDQSGAAAWIMMMKRTEINESKFTLSVETDLTM